MPSGGHNRYWTDELIEKQLREITGSIGSFPTATELRQLGRNDVACIVTKRGGFQYWAERLGLSRKHSDSDTGWDGEKEVMQLFQAGGIECIRSEGIKAPFDLLAGGVLKIDVKTAKYAEYRSNHGKNVSSGWYYRFGKTIQADIAILYQLDTREFWGLPWWECPVANITIRPGGKWEQYRNNWPLIHQMLGMRLAERARFGMPVAEVA